MVLRQLIARCAQLLAMACCALVQASQSPIAPKNADAILKEFTVQQLELKKAQRKEVIDDINAKMPDFIKQLDEVNKKKHLPDLDYLKSMLTKDMTLKEDATDKDYFENVYYALGRTNIKVGAQYDHYKQYEQHSCGQGFFGRKKCSEDKKLREWLEPTARALEDLMRENNMLDILNKSVKKYENDLSKKPDGLQTQKDIRRERTGLLYSPLEPTIGQRVAAWWQSTSNWLLNTFKTAQPQTPQPIAVPKSVQPKTIGTKIWGKSITDSNFPEYYEQRSVSKPMHAGDVYNPADYPAYYFER